MIEKTKNNYVKECSDCGNVVQGQVKRGFVREAVHEGPSTVVEFLPVGGKLISQVAKEGVKRFLKTDMDKWGDELEKWIYKDIQVEYCCPKCGKDWTETHELSESEYKEVIAEYTNTLKGFYPGLSKQDSIKDKDEETTPTNQQGKSIGMKLQIPYYEVSNFIKEKYQQQIDVAFVNENTVCVSKEIKLIISKKVNANISVLQVANNDITLCYQSGMGIEILMKGALKWFKESVKDFVEEQDADNKLILHLDKIEQLRNTLKQIEIQSINFDAEHINVQFLLSYL